MVTRVEIINDMAKSSFTLMITFTYMNPSPTLAGMG